MLGIKKGYWKNTLDKVCPESQGILMKHCNQILHLCMDLHSSVLAEVIAIPFAPLAVTLHKAHISHTVHLTIGRGKIHPLLATVFADSAVKQGVDAGIGLVQKRDEIVFRHSLGFGVQTLLPVQCFQLHPNRIHECMLAQFYPVVKPIAGDLPGIRLVGLYFAQSIVPIILYFIKIPESWKVLKTYFSSGYTFLAVPSQTIHQK